MWLPAPASRQPGAGPSSLPLTCPGQDLQSGKEVLQANSLSRQREKRAQEIQRVARSHPGDKTRPVPSQGPLSPSFVLPAMGHLVPNSPCTCDGSLLLAPHTLQTAVASRLPCQLPGYLELNMQVACSAIELLSPEVAPARPQPLWHRQVMFWLSCNSPPPHPKQRG